jgi:hypothetical protein
MTAVTDAAVERLLRDAAPAASWPPTPDLRARVVARIEAAGTPEGRTRVTSPRAGVPSRAVPRPGLRRAGAVALALIVLLVLAAVAAALGFRLPGIDIVRVASLPPAGSGLEQASPAALDLGSPVPVDRARALDRPHVLLPATLPPPDVAYVLGAGDQTIATVVWRASASQASLPGSDLSLSLMAVPGDTREDLVTKMLGPDSTVERVTVGGSPGWWISGAPHQIVIERPGGDVDAMRPSLAGDTLVFVRDGTVYRLESTLGRDATIAIAESLR